MASPPTVRSHDLPAHVCDLTPQALTPTYSVQPSSVLEAWPGLTWPEMMKVPPLAEDKGTRFWTELGLGGGGAVAGARVSPRPILLWDRPRPLSGLVAAWPCEGLSERMVAFQ